LFPGSSLYLEGGRERILGTRLVVGDLSTDESEKHLVRKLFSKRRTAKTFFTVC